MVNQRTALYILLISICCIILIFFLINSDTCKIKRRFHYLAGQIEKESNESKLLASAKANKISRCFNDPCHLDIYPYNLSGNYSRDAIITHSTVARSQFETISIDIYDLTIDFPEKSRALANLTAYVQALPLDNSMETIDEVREFSCKLSEEDAEWFFLEIRAIDVLEK